jgi:hypothetical protein
LVSFLLLLSCERNAEEEEEEDEEGREDAREEEAAKRCARAWRRLISSSSARSDGIGTFAVEAVEIVVFFTCLLNAGRCGA